MSANHSYSFAKRHQERVLAVNLISENACLDNYYNLVIDKIYCAEILRFDGTIQREYFRQQDMAACISLSRMIRLDLGSGSYKNVKRDMGNVWGLPYRAPRVQDLLQLNPELSNPVMINDMIQSPSSLSQTERSKLIQMRHEVRWNPVRPLNLRALPDNQSPGHQANPVEIIFDPDNW